MRLLIMYDGYSYYLIPLLSKYKRNAGTLGRPKHVWAHFSWNPTMQQFPPYRATTLVCPENEDNPVTLTWKWREEESAIVDWYTYLSVKI